MKIKYKFFIIFKSESVKEIIIISFLNIKTKINKSVLKYFYKLKE